MEHQLWLSIVAALATVHKARKPTNFDFSDEDIVRVHYWSVIHDRPTRWACDPRHWPVHRRRTLLPSPATMSRRLRCRSVRTLLDALAQRVIAPTHPGVFWIIDGKPLPIGGCSKDRQAGYGRAAGGNAKGYKLHALVNQHGQVAVWRVAPMNVDERVMAARLIKSAPEQVQGYVVTDSNYDSNPLHEVCQKRAAGALQLVNRRRYGAKHGHGHRKQTPGRLRSKALLENPRPQFGERLLHDRSQVERDFGRLVNWGGSLTCLPAWVRTHRRVRRWVQAKLVLTMLKPVEQTVTYAA